MHINRATLHFIFQKNVIWLLIQQGGSPLLLFKFALIFCKIRSNFLFSSGAIQHYVSHYSNSHTTKWQPFKANVSPLTIDGSSQMSSFKSASRMNEFFYFSRNAKNSAL